MYITLESKINDHSLEELEMLDEDFYMTVIRELFELKHSGTNKHLNALKRFSEEIASVDIEKAFKSKEKGFYYCAIKKVWIARRMVNKKRITIATGTYDDVYTKYIAFCKKNNLKISS